MIRESSQNAYICLQERGEINRQELIIIRALIQSGEKDLTRKQLARLTNLETSSVSGRVNRLVSNGYLVETNPRKCPISGMTVTPVALVDRQPTQLKMAV